VAAGGEKCTAALALTFRSASWQCKTAGLNVGAIDFGEQSENVYENKGSVKKSTTPNPSLSKEGNFRLPLLG
jgi:hypothetical protein